MFSFDNHLIKQQFSLYQKNRIFKKYCCYVQPLFHTILFVLLYVLKTFQELYRYELVRIKRNQFFLSLSQIACQKIHENDVYKNQLFNLIHRILRLQS